MIQQSTTYYGVKLYVIGRHYPNNSDRFTDEQQEFHIYEAYVADSTINIVDMLNRDQLNEIENQILTEQY